MSTLSEIRTAVQGNWPNNYFASFLDDTKTDEYINAVQRWVCRGTILTPDFKMVNHSFSWMKQEATRDTSDGTQTYSIPTAGDSDWTEVNSETVRKYKKEVSLELINADGYRVPLTRRHKKDIERDMGHREEADSGTPRDYCIDQDLIWLYPVPDHSLNSASAWEMNLEFYGYMADLSGDSATNEITNTFPDVLEYGATEMGFRYGQDYEQAEYYNKKKQELFIEMLRLDQAEVLSNIERGMEPITGSNLGEGDPGYSGYYTNDTPYS